MHNASDRACCFCVEICHKKQTLLKITKETLLKIAKETQITVLASVLFYDRSHYDFFSKKKT